MRFPSEREHFSANVIHALRVMRPRAKRMYDYVSASYNCEPGKRLLETRLPRRLYLFRSDAPCLYMPLNHRSRPYRTSGGCVSIYRSLRPIIPFAEGTLRIAKSERGEIEHERERESERERSVFGSRGCRPKLVREIRACAKASGRDIEMRREIADAASSSSPAPAGGPHPRGWCIVSAIAIIILAVAARAAPMHTEGHTCVAFEREGEKRDERQRDGERRGQERKRIINISARVE